jgi:hypothetical protein
MLAASLVHKKVTEAQQSSIQDIIVERIHMMNQRVSIRATATTCTATVAHVCAVRFVLTHLKGATLCVQQ